MTSDRSVSILILTCNRLERLRALLDALLPQLTDDDEVVVLDTGSLDGTRDYFASWRHAKLRVLTCDDPGGWATWRNRLVGAARCPRAAFIDDDCLPTADWVARGRAALDDADAVGGPVRPLGIREWPPWWHPEMGWMAGLSVPGHSGPDAGRIHYPTTANLWARTAALAAVPFDEPEVAPFEGALGRYAQGREDAHWWRRMRTGGWRVRFDAELIVEHAIDPERLRPAYLRQRAVLDGIAWARREGTAEDLEPLAYRWWQVRLAAWAALLEPPDTRDAQRLLTRLTAERHAAALGALVARFPLRGLGSGGAARAWLLSRAGVRLVRDRAKNAARELARPWLAARPLQPTERQVARLAVIAFGCTGDLIILQSALRGLTQAHPRVEIYVLGPPAARVALNGVRRLNLTVVPADLRAAHPHGPTRWIEEWLRRLDPDAIVTPYLHGPWGAALVRLARPPRPLVGFDRDHGLARRWMEERLSVRVHKRFDVHESDNLCALFDAVGLPCEPEPPALVPDPAALARAREASAAVGVDDASSETAPWILFNPDAGHAQKEWTDDGWARLASWALERTGARLAVNLFRPHPELERAMQAAAGAHAERIQWLRAVPLEELVAWIAQARAVVTVDAAPQHLAHALGTPSVTLYGPMDERRWRDRWRRPIHRTVRGCAFDLTPEERRGLAINHLTALIDPERVWEALEAVLTDAR